MCLCNSGSWRAGDANIRQPVKQRSGQNLSNLQLTSMATASGRNFAAICLRTGRVTSAADAADAFLPQEVFTELRRAPHRPAPDHVRPRLAFQHTVALKRKMLTISVHLKLDQCPGPTGGNIMFCGSQAVAGKLYFRGFLQSELLSVPGSSGA